MTDLIMLARSHADALRNYRTPSEPVGTVEILDRLVVVLDAANERADAAEQLRSALAKYADPLRYHLEAPAYPWGQVRRCRLCQVQSHYNGPLPHAPDCPVRLAREAAEAARKENS